MRRDNKNRKSSKTKLIIFVIIIILLIIGIFVYFKLNSKMPETYLENYVSKINESSYEEMYDLIDDESKNKISKEDFVTRNKNIYQGIDLTNMNIEILNKEKLNGKSYKITYNTKMNVSGGEVSFQNTAILNKDKNNDYKISWSSNLIFPELGDTDKVKVNTIEATRGNLLDRNEIGIAVNGKASSVGIVPQKLGEQKEENIKKIVELLDLTIDTINNKLQASWVKEDSFVPIKTISKDETTLKENLLQIPGVKITTVDAREYPLGEAASHLTGYMKNITKEELEKMSGYSSTSLIGKAGLEKIYESRLKGEDGLEIYIVDKDGNRKNTIIKQEKKDGEDVKLTIDSSLQQNLYNELKDDAGLFVVMNYKTGEILALVSTPSYDVNKMTLGISDSEWNEISSNEKTPMMARYLQSYCPGSTFKPITAAIGLTTNTLTPDETFSYSDLSWQKDSSWGDYKITTLTKYDGPKNMKNALIHSDNIYFAQAALKIGSSNIENMLNKLKFNEEINFEMGLSKSKYSNSDKIKSETLLADTGYGQGEILVNPIHMASIYSAFVNEGNMVKPYLEYKDNKDTTYIAENVFTKEAVDEVKDDLIQVVENPEGTAKDMKINGMTIAGKTGTAELKVSKDTTGKTLGWFDCFTLDDNLPYLFIGMVEDASSNGGSHHVIPMIRKMLIK